MKITFLGTGTSSGVPMIACGCEVCQSTDPHDKRLRASVLVEHQGKTLLIDAGPDFRYQMLRAGIKRLDGILITHSHKDHIAGLDDIRAFNFFMQQAIPVWCTAETERALRREYAYAFETPSYPGIPRMQLMPFDNHPFEAAGMEVLPIRALHAQMEVFGFRIGSFAYLTDANYLPEAEQTKLQGATVVVLNALRREPHPSHFSLSEAQALGTASGASQVFFTHISHQLGLHQEVSQSLSAPFRLAYDGLVLNLPALSPV